jgi:hypothetical protein
VIPKVAKMGWGYVFALIVGKSFSSAPKSVSLRWTIVVQGDEKAETVIFKL